MQVWMCKVCNNRENWIGDYADETLRQKKKKIKKRINWGIMGRGVESVGREAERVESCRS